jgi:hypothetical protein
MLKKPELRFSGRVLVREKLRPLAVGAFAALPLIPGSICVPGMVVVLGGLIGVAAVVLAVVTAVAAVAGGAALAAAVVTSPYLLVRHLRRHRSGGRDRRVPRPRSAS